MSGTIHHTEQSFGASTELEVPVKLFPHTAKSMFPGELIPEDIRRIKAAGWARLGTVAAIINSDKQVLILEHAESDKSPEGALGPLAETVRICQRNGAVQAEKTADTLYRSFQEELGIANPEELNLRAKRIGAWTLSSWPVGIKQPDELALAVCPVVRIPDSSKDKVLGSINSHEIRQSYFMNPEDIFGHANVRPGVHEWLIHLISSGLMDTSEENLVEADFSCVISDTYGWRNALLQEIDV